MKVSAISQSSSEECKPRRNAFISYSNSFMSIPFEEAEKTNQVNPSCKKMGIEELQNSSIFPKEIIGGKTVIIA